MAPSSSSTQTVAVITSPSPYSQAGALTAALISSPHTPTRFCIFKRKALYTSHIYKCRVLLLYVLWRRRNVE